LDSDSREGKARWEGPARLFDGREARSRNVAVTIDPDALEIQEGETAGRYRRDGLDLIDRHEDGHFRLGLKAHPGAVLVFESREALRALEDWGLVRRRRMRGFSWGQKIAALLALIAALVSGFYLFGLDWTTEAIVGALPAKTDRLLGNAAMAGLAKAAAVDSNAKLASALNKSAAALAAMEGHGLDSVRILIIPDTSVKNAFAFPGGYIVVYTGILRMLDDQQEWLGLLAHEGGHIAKRHGLRRMVRASLLAAVASIFLGDISGLTSALIDNGKALINLDYSRKDEAEADAFAAARLQATGHSTAGMIRLFEKFAAMEKQPKWAAFLSTHPATEDRILHLKAGAKAPRKPKNFLTASEWKALKGV
jgi:Zn-dependent protease with chaperone function